VLVGTAAGAIAGFLIGGIGGRLAMLLLRLTSSDLVLGVTSDDGFEIGVISAQTFQLLLAMTTLGAMNGVLYAALRAAIPGRLRLPLWVGFAALVGGSLFVHDEGVDFTLISPALLAIALFVLLPGVAAALVVLLVERWDREAAWRNRRLTVLVVVARLDVRARSRRARHRRLVPRQARGWAGAVASGRPNRRAGRARRDCRHRRYRPRRRVQPHPPLGRT